jgi:hypothetical protein
VTIERHDELAELARQMAGIGAKDPLSAPRRNTRDPN